MPNWKKLITSGSDAALNSLNVTSALTASGLIYPTSDGTGGQVIVTDGAGNLSFDLPDAEKITFSVQNDFTSTLAKGTPIHITSTTNGTSLVIPASASDASTMPAHGILNAQLAVGVDGEATIVGQITGVDTSGFSSGDTVYVGASGGYTNVKPQGSGNLIQNLGVVKKVDASNGTGEIFGSGRSNDVPNLPEGKIWVGSSTYTVTSSIVTLDEDNSQAQITGSLTVNGSIITYQENTDVDTGTETVATISTGSYDAAFFDFVIKNSTNLRAGTVYATHDGTNIEFTETSTNDLGDTSDVTLSVDISGADLRLRATTTSDNWTIKSLVRGL